MPIKITKKSKKTKKGKGKATQSQQVIVNIQKGKRKASSQPVSRPSQPPIIIQQPQQDFSQLENLFKQYSTSRPVAEPKPVTMGMDTQTETSIMVERFDVEPLLQPLKETQKQLNETLSQLNLEKEFLDTERLKKAIDTNMVSERHKKRGLRKIERPNIIPNTPIKVISSATNRPIMVGGDLYNKLVKEGKLKPE